MSLLSGTAVTKFWKVDHQSEATRVTCLYILFSSHQDAHLQQNQHHFDRLNITAFIIIYAILAS